MNRFEYVSPETIEGALTVLNGGEGARILAGGTDVLGEMKRGISSPSQLVNLKSIPELRGIRQDQDGSLTLGALTKLNEAAEHPAIVEHHPLLVQAISEVASLQIRNIGSLGGNLCQRPRCVFFRHPDFHCYRKGGEGCFAARGQSRCHAIFGERRCITVHPSDVAPALLALEADVNIISTSGLRTISLDQFFSVPREDCERENILRQAEILVEIRVPPPLPNARCIYLKVSERKAMDFALASVALVLCLEGRRVTQARVVLGGVAAAPWRARDAESQLLDTEMEDEAIRHTCEAALKGARPLRHNEYKIALVKGLLRKAIKKLRLDNGQVRHRQIRCDSIVGRLHAASA